MLEARRGFAGRPMFPGTHLPIAMAPILAELALTHGPMSRGDATQKVLKLLNRFADRCPRPVALERSNRLVQSLGRFLHPVCVHVSGGFIHDLSSPLHGDFVVEVR